MVDNIYLCSILAYLVIPMKLLGKREVAHILIYLILGIMCIKILLKCSAVNKRKKGRYGRGVCTI